MELTPNDFPELYDAANCASLNAQNYHLMIIKAYLTLLVTGSVFTMYSDEIENAPSFAIGIFLMTLLLSVLQAYKRFDKIWYNGRAVAESIKTRSWRYMMKAEPYQDVDDINIVRAQFRSELKEILKENKDLGDNLNPTKGLGESVTDKMNLIRSLDMEERLNIYRKERIDDQRKWYARKAGINKRWATTWFCCVIVAHAFIIAFLIYKITHPKLVLPTDALIVIVGGIITWTQVKKYHELSTVYMLTAREIGIIKGDSEEVKTESQLSDFVKDAENAFSREHTQWFARKDS